LVTSNEHGRIHTHKGGPKN